MSEVAARVPAWICLPLGWTAAAALRSIDPHDTGIQLIAVGLLALVWTPAIIRFWTVPGRYAASFGGILLMVLVSVVVVPGFERTAVRLPFEIVVTTPFAYVLIDRPARSARAWQREKQH